MGGRHTRLAAALSAAWELEVVSGRTLAALAEACPDPAARARLSVLAAYCRAHASRLIARLSALGQGPLPVPRPENDVPDDLRAALLAEAEVARLSAQHYGDTAVLAREMADLSSAWVCELNRVEEEDRADELRRLGEGQGALWASRPAAESPATFS